MGNKMDHVSTSKLRHVLVDFSIADPADKDAEDHGATSKIEVIRTKAMLEEIVDDTTDRHRIQVKAARVSWAQRLLNWF